jgi:hypothetical protein
MESKYSFGNLWHVNTTGRQLLVLTCASSRDWDTRTQFDVYIRSSKLAL